MEQSNNPSSSASVSVITHIVTSFVSTYIHGLNEQRNPTLDLQ